MDVEKKVDVAENGEENLKATKNGRGKYRLATNADIECAYE